MPTSRTDVTVVAVAVAYLVTLGLAMGNVPYDLWGALVVVPPLGVIGVIGVRRMFAGEFSALTTVMSLGLGVKLVGTIARYWMAFDAYGGASDAERYHQNGVRVAALVWSGERPLLAMLPAGTGTDFMDRFTGFVYIFIGSSKLAAFLFFGWMAYWGVALTVKAACIAVPGLARRRYALLCVLAPSLVFWPSSIGKEAWMLLWLGITAYGFAKLVTRRGFLGPLITTVAGLGGTFVMRPHIAGMWLAGMVPGLLVAMRRPAGADGVSRPRNTMRMLFGLTVAAAALVIVGKLAVEYLQPPGEDAGTASQITSILDRNTEQTTGSGSSFTAPSIARPTDWPIAVVRTLTRPLLFEAESVAQLAASLEMTAFVAFCFIERRRLANLPRLMLRSPFVMFAMTTLFLVGLGYSSFGNLGILTRQKSLVVAFMALLVCLPQRAPRLPRSAINDERMAGHPAVRSAREHESGALVG